MYISCLTFPRASWCVIGAMRVESFRKKAYARNNLCCDRLYMGFLFSCQLEWMRERARRVATFDNGFCFRKHCCSSTSSIDWLMEEKKKQSVANGHPHSYESIGARGVSDGLHITLAQPGTLLSLTVGGVDKMNCTRTLIDDIDCEIFGV